MNPFDKERAAIDRKIKTARFTGSGRVKELEREKVMVTARELQNGFKAARSPLWTPWKRVRRCFGF